MRIIVNARSIGGIRRFSRTVQLHKRNPLEEYNYQVEQKVLCDDPYQRKIITSMIDLHSRLESYKPPKVELPSIDDVKPKSGFLKLLLSFGGGFFNSKKLVDALGDEFIRGIYLYGDVGCGKTMLMDLFYKTIPDHLAKRRLHFHQFMQYLHKRSHQLKMEHGLFDLDVMPILASEIAQQSTILCFDEFQVTDVADAMLLRRLLESVLLPLYGVVLFATSNRAPDDLYINGIQRVSFIPCIQQIKRQTKVIYLNSPTDYRKVPKPLLPVYYSPKPGVKYNSKASQLQREEHARQWYSYFSGDQKGKTGYTVNVWGRKLEVPKSTPPKVAQFTFEELCGSPLAAGDYLQLASHFRAFIVTDIPYLSIDSRDRIRRFITFLDAAYDAGCKLCVTLAAPFKDIFVEPEDIAAEKFELYKSERKKSKGEAVGVENDELVTKHGFSKEVAKKANMFDSDEERFAFARALSRLSQMSTKEWVDRE